VTDEGFKLGSELSNFKKFSTILLFRCSVQTWVIYSRTQEYPLFAWVILIKADVVRTVP